MLPVDATRALGHAGHWKLNERRARPLRASPHAPYQQAKQASWSPTLFSGNQMCLLRLQAGPASNCICRIERRSPLFAQVGHSILVEVSAPAARSDARTGKVRMLDATQCESRRVRVNVADTADSVSAGAHRRPGWTIPPTACMVLLTTAWR
eukprot:6211149-Pleurochrysis_carterae.AAC.5